MLELVQGTKGTLSSGRSILGLRHISENNCLTWQYPGPQVPRSCSTSLSREVGGAEGFRKL